MPSHSAATKAAAQKRVVNAPERLSISNDETERFPEDKIESLIQHGFIVGDTQDYRSQTMSMLLDYGGLRKSKIFHIFASDITIHPTHNDEALVHVYHPVYGTSLEELLTSKIVNVHPFREELKRLLSLAMWQLIISEYGEHRWQQYCCAKGSYSRCSQESTSTTIP